MSQNPHLNVLVSKHRNLDQFIQSEMAHPAHDPAKLTQLKRQKLRLKEQISKLSQQTQ